MQKVNVICVGRLKERFYIDAAAEYMKRLQAFCDLSVIELAEQRLGDAPADAQIERALALEAEAIRAKLPKGGAVVAMCVEGKGMSSEQLCDTMQRFAVSGKSQLTFLIGGSFGLHPSVKALADVRLSMSAMTFPHHMARIMLLEQTYRAYQIGLGTRYHK